MHPLGIVQWNSTRWDHPGNPGGVSGSGPFTSATDTNTNTFFFSYTVEYIIICIKTFAVGHHFGINPIFVQYGIICPFQLDHLQNISEFSISKHLQNKIRVYTRWSNPFHECMVRSLFRHREALTLTLILYSLCPHTNSFDTCAMTKTMR